MLYYTSWCLTDCSSISCGLGYNGKDEKTGKHKWDRIVGVNILEVELGLTPNEMVKHWNHMVHLWLKNYVHTRIVRDG